MKKKARTYQEIHDELIKKIRKDYGPRCEIFNINCICCQAYLMLDMLENAAELEK